MIVCEVHKIGRNRPYLWVMLKIQLNLISLPIPETAKKCILAHAVFSLNVGIRGIKIQEYHIEILKLCNTTHSINVLPTYCNKAISWGGGGGDCEHVHCLHTI